MDNYTYTLTDTQKRMLEIAYSNGKRIGRKLADEIESGELTIPENQNLEIFIDKVVDYDFPASSKLIAKLFSQDSTYMVGNMIFAGGGLAISYSSIKNYFRTKNRVAKCCYALSGFCGTTSIAAGTYATATRYCGFSKLAAGGDSFGGALLWIGHKADAAGKYLEGKKSLNPFGHKKVLRRPDRTKGRYYKGLSFITNSPSYYQDVDIPIKKIVIISGTIFTIYSYGKFIVRVYKWIKKKTRVERHLIISSFTRALYQSECVQTIKQRQARIAYAALLYPYFNFKDY